MGHAGSTPKICCFQKGTLDRVDVFVSTISLKNKTEHPDIRMQHHTLNT